MAHTDILARIEQEIPLLGEMHLGHTPLQIEFFKTSQQKGSRKFEYWHHLVQMKALSRAIREAWIDIEEVEMELNDLGSFWQKLRHSKEKRRIKGKRLRLKLQDLKALLEEKELEISRHLTVVLRDFGDLLALKEADIMSAEAEYWVHRLSRQLAYGRLALQQGVPAGEVAAIAALPQDMAQQVLDEAQKILAAGILGVQKQIGS